MGYIIIGVVVAFVVIVIGSTTWWFLRLNRKPKNKGDIGEEIVAKILGESIPGEQYVINNLIFYTAPHITMQIDHILINRNGIWVIETKNYAGKVEGGEKSPVWTQILAGGKVRNEIANPIRQNSAHIYRLVKYLNVNHIFNNVVVFIDTDIHNVRYRDVYTIDELPTITRLEGECELTEKQMLYYYKRLIHLKKYEVTREEHMKNDAEMQKNLANNICPICHNPLELKTGERGSYYGCTNTSVCHYRKSKYAEKEVDL